MGDPVHLDAVLEGSAENPALPPELVRRLLPHRGGFGCKQVACRADLSEDVIEEIVAADLKSGPWRPADLVVFPQETLRRFATDPAPRMRCLAPRDPGLPAELCARLAADPDSTVREAIAGHPNLNPRVLVELLGDESEGPARAAAASLWLPVTQMERLVTLAGL